MYILYLFLSKLEQTQNGIFALLSHYVNNKIIKNVVILPEKKKKQFFSLFKNKILGEAGAEGDIIYFLKRDINKSFHLLPTEGARCL